MAENEQAPEPKLADPVESAEGFARALAGIAKDQQRRIVVANAEIQRLQNALWVLADQADHNWTRLHARKALGLEA